MSMTSPKVVATSAHPSTAAQALGVNRDVNQHLIH